MTKALEHLRVLDLSRIFAGPWASQNLADLGAHVIKVERPGRGDDTRAWGPPFLQDAQGNDTNNSSYFMAVNRGKHSITIDIATAEGQEIIRELVKTVDVLVENYKVGTLKRYGLDYESLSAINPRLVYCSITGFGQTGPYAPLPGYDFVFQGMSGLMSLTGKSDSEPGGGPMKYGVAITDLTTGMYASFAILAAIEHRHVSGRGQHIDLSLLDCAVSLTSYMSMNYFMSGKVPQRMGNVHSNIVPYQVFRCKEGDVIMAVGNDSQFADMCQAIGMPELAQDERFARNFDRVRHRTELEKILEVPLKQKSMLEWVEIFEKHNVPCGPIYTLDQVFEDVQVKHRGMKTTLAHESGAQVPSVDSPIRLSDTPVNLTHSAPSLGAATEQILKHDLGLTDDQIKGLKQKGII
ncbi:CaiB/BaiF CoA transferase family protein [Orrella daihaiensis]|uniref:CoA transferase n=1 Tax=Orrella daihaiensis TaxID=2782176 RepID=A0ABY4AGH4_9BURK|nr:CaiB/BaiF CoA-transferase family protein [Orrella daihaiensis]UOD49394.1 CoA transferase [Orrella daihaiensis]